MKKTNENRPSVIAFSSQLPLFSERNQRPNTLRPLYLFCTGEAENKLFFFISSSRSHCWVKKTKAWEKLEINDLLIARDGGSKTYCFKTNNYHIDTIHIPYPFRNNAQYTSFKKAKTFSLVIITLSQEEMDVNDISNLEAFDVTGIPETRMQAQQQLELAEKKQTIEREIQKIGNIIHGLQHELEIILSLETPVTDSVDSLMKQIHYYQTLKADLNERQRLLEQSAEITAEAAIQTMGAMKI